MHQDSCRVTASSSTSVAAVSAAAAWRSVRVGGAGPRAAGGQWPVPSSAGCAARRMPGPRPQADLLRLRLPWEAAPAMALVALVALPWAQALRAFLGVRCVRLASHRPRHCLRELRYVRA